jgi:Chaperonin 10 Kd subunit
MSWIERSEERAGASSSWLRRFRQWYGVVGQENRTQSSAASAGRGKAVEVQLLGNNGDLCSTVPGLSLRARLGSLTPYPENRTSIIACAVKEGDRILFGKYSGSEIKIDGEDFLIIKEEEVLGVISGASKKETVIALAVLYPFKIRTRRPRPRSALNWRVIVFLVPSGGRPAGSTSRSTTAMHSLPAAGGRRRRADGTERFLGYTRGADVDRETRRAQYQAAMLKLQAS